MLFTGRRHTQVQKQKRNGKKCWLGGFHDGLPREGGGGGRDLAEHELVLVLLEELHRALLVQEEAVHALHVLDGDLGALPLPAHQARHRDQLDGVPVRQINI
jgi:hypothetical protein